MNYYFFFFNDIEDISNSENVCIEIYTDLIIDPVSKYNEDCDGEVVRLYKTENYDENEEDVYQPIVKKNGEKGTKNEKVETIDKNKRPKIMFHCNSYVKVLWSIKQWGSMENCMKSCLLECEVVDMWCERIECLKKFIDENKKKPSKCSKNSDEKILGSWLVTQNQNFKNRVYGMKDSKRFDVWKMFLEEYNEYVLSIDELWYKNLETLKEFIEINKRRPSSDNPNKKEEHWVGEWLLTQNKNNKNRKEGMICDRRHYMWSAFLEEYKEYLLSSDELWYSYFAKLKEFIDINKRRPTGTWKRKEERVLGIWFIVQNRNHKNSLYGMKNEQRYDTWSIFLEEYKEFVISIDDVWDANFANLKEFIDSNEKRPSSTSIDKNEKALACWICKQNKDHKSRLFGMTCDLRYGMWTEFLEQFNKYLMTIDDKWDTNFERLKEFINTNKKGPSDKTDKVLTKWVYHQNENCKHRKKSMKDDDRFNTWNKLLEDYKQYFVSNDKNSKSKPMTPMDLKAPTKKTEEIVKETTEQRKQRTKSQMEILHQRYKTLSSTNLNKEFSDNNNLWNEYHELSEKNEESFPQEEIPRNRIIQEISKLGTKRTKIVVDMGCGRAQLSRHFSDLNDTRFKFINYDHVSSNESVISCDVSKVPLESDSVEIAILSLALWGSNCDSYISEAHRILESNGLLYIMEATKRWSEKDENHNLIEGEEGGKLKKKLEENGFLLTSSKIEKFSMFICIKK
jgi:Hypothetical methyltransferase